MGQFFMGLLVVCNLGESNSITTRKLGYKVDARSLTLRSLLQPWLTFLWLVIVRSPLASAHAHARVIDPSVFASIDKSVKRFNFEVQPTPWPSIITSAFTGSRRRWLVGWIWRLYFI
jgi:hypothetical protein